MWTKRRPAAAGSNTTAAGDPDPLNDVFHYRGAALYAEDVNLAVLAEHHGTPAYVYSRAALEARWRAFDHALADIPHLICYAVKANSNLAVLNLLARLGSGFDIVSSGELMRVIHAGGDPAHIVFSGVGKRADEMAQALQLGIRCFNVESEAELLRLNAVAGSLGQRAPVSLRVNPDVDAGTHPYIATGLKDNYFGIDFAAAHALYLTTARLPHIEAVGIDCHIGSQLTSMAPFAAALDRVLALVDVLRAAGVRLQHVDLGGGLGVRYRDEAPPTPEDYAHVLKSAVQARGLELILEPGRAIAGPAGLLLTRVEYLKHTPHKNFAVVDAAMNDLARPALYDAWHEILPVLRRSESAQRYDVVGPVCESGDFLGKARDLCIEPRDLLAVATTGAYGFTMSSNYNTRVRPPEIMVEGRGHHLVRERERVEQLFAHEHLLPPDVGCLTPL